MKNDFNRLLKLSKKTGDTLIVYDASEGEHMVVMPLYAYESLHSHAEEFGMDDTDMEEDSDFDRFEDESEDIRDIEAVNRDISAWQEAHRNQDDIQDEPSSDPHARETEWRSTGQILAAQHDDRNREAAGAEHGRFHRPITRPEDEEPTIKPIPRAQYPASVSDSEEEPLEEEPIFFEEPVE